MKRTNGLYITPAGAFSTTKQVQKELKIGGPSIQNWCKKDTVITEGSYQRSKFLSERFSRDIIGKNASALGFSFVDSSLLASA